MANKRNLKKAINNMCSELFIECVAIPHYQKSVEQGDLDNIMKSVLLLQENMLNRVSHPEPGMKAKEYYQKLRTDMAGQASAIADQIYALV